ncbi:MAG: hypothetical protein ACM3S1_13750, partial [Hyphomicrobiales bacterium]
MRRLATSFAALLVTLAAALHGGAAVFSARASDPCLQPDPANLLPAVEQSQLIVVGTVQTYNGGARARIQPEAFLKGAASSDPIDLRYEEPAQCDLARLEDGQRILAFLPVDDRGVLWPNAGRVFWLEDGRTVAGGDPPPPGMRAAHPIHDIRTLTEQYAVPAESADEGAGIDWLKTVLPVSVATLALF